MKFNSVLNSKQALMFGVSAAFLIQKSLARKLKKRALQKPTKQLVLK